MNPIEPAELSAYLDGELNPARAREVESALATSPALQAELDALTKADKTWRMAARLAAFRSTIQLPRTSSRKVPLYRTAGAVVLLLAVRFLPKLAGALDWGLIANGVALAIAMVWVIRMTRAEERQGDGIRHGAIARG